MVNVAREIGLGKERAPWQEGEHETRPSSRPDARRPWEDFRRVVWFDVMFYDLCVSLCNLPFLVFLTLYQVYFRRTRSDFPHPPHVLFFPVTRACWQPLRSRHQEIRACALPVRFPALASLLH